jgi:alpha/beta hydrolase fold.
MLSRTLFSVAITLGAAVAQANTTQQRICRTHSDDMLQALQKHDYAAATAHLDARMQTALDANKLRQTWEQMLPQKFGAYDHATETRVQSNGTATVAETPLHFANGWLSMRVSCDATGKVSGLFFARGQVPSENTTQATMDTTAANEHSMEIASPLGPLPGTLTLPSGKGPFPAVLLVAGSGPNDRDETIGPNKPFRDLAQALATAGIASLRYDKRTHIYGAQIAGKAITVDDEVTDDAVTALQLLGQQSQIDPHRLFVLGHSLGGLMAPRIAQRQARLAGVILLAAPVNFGIDTILRQSRYIGRLKGISAHELDAQLASIVTAHDTIAHADPAHPPTGILVGAPMSYWLSLRTYDPIAVAKTLHTPMLILQGDSDYQVTPNDDYAHWKTTFAHDPRVQMHDYPGLSHLFMPAGTPPGPADYDKPGHVDARVLRDISTWVIEQPAVP